MSGSNCHRQSTDFYCGMRKISRTGNWKIHKYRRKNTEEYGIKCTVEWGRYQEEGIEKNHKYRRKNTEEHGIKSWEMQTERIRVESNKEEIKTE